MPRLAISHLALSLVALLLAGEPAQGEVTITGTASEPFWDVQNCEDCAPYIDSLTFIGRPPLAFLSGDPAVDVPRPGLICTAFALGEPWIHFAENDPSRGPLPMPNCLTALHMGTEVVDPP